MSEFDLKTYNDIASGIPDVGYGPERDVGPGAAGTGDFDVSTFDFSNLDKGASSEFDWSSFAAAAVNTAGQITTAVINKESGSKAGSKLPEVAKDQKVTSRTDFGSLPGLQLPETAAPQPAAQLPAAPKAPGTPAVSTGSNAALYVGLGLGATALFAGIAIAASRRRKRRAY